MNLNGTQETEELRNKLLQLHRKLQECEGNITWTTAKRIEEGPLNPFQRKFFKELDEAYQREKRALAAEIGRIERSIRTRETNERT